MRTLQLVLDGALMTGDDVAALQRELAERGFPPGKIDGIFGVGTAAAVRAFQQSEGDLLVDGLAGPRTQARLGLTRDAALVHKKIPVALHPHLDFAPEYQLKEPIHLQPDSILISGPTTLIGSIYSWPTDSMILSDLKHTTRLELALQQPPKGILLEASKVKAFIEVEAYTSKALFIPLSIINAPDSVRVFPDKIKLECTVGLSFYEEVDVNDFKLEVDIGGARLREGKTTVPIVLKRSPDFVRNIHFTPQAVEFFIFQDR